MCIYQSSSLEIEIGGPKIQGHSWICIEILVWLKLYETLKLTFSDLKKKKGKIEKNQKEKKSGIAILEEMEIYIIYMCIWNIHTELMSTHSRWRYSRPVWQVPEEGLVKSTIGYGDLSRHL